MRNIIILGLQMLLCTLSFLFPDDRPINAEEPLTVCQVLQNLPLYAGKVIQVRGEWRGSCLDEDCPTPLKTEKHEWPNSILLVNPLSLGKNDEPANWDFMNPAYYERLFWDTLKNYKKMYATVSGRLDERAVLLKYQNTSETMPGGYGHLGYWPARIIMMEIKDIKGGEPREPGSKIEALPFE